MVLAYVVSALLILPSLALASVEISSEPTSNISCSGGVCTPTAADAVLNSGDLANMLASGDVTVKSTSIAPDIKINVQFGWVSGSRLTLDSYRSIAVNKPVVVSGAGAMTIETNDGGSGGDYRFFHPGRIVFRDLKSKLVINGDRYELADHIARIKRLIQRTNFIALSENYNAGHYRGGPISGAPSIFEGLGNTISNFAPSGDSSLSDNGLFEEAKGVRDLNLTNVNVQMGYDSTGFMGAIAAEVPSDGFVKYCHVSGRIIGPEAAAVGGLVGSNAGKISFSSSSALVSAGDGWGDTAGGLAGFNAGSIEESFSTGDVDGGAEQQLGGLVGVNAAAISNSYATGSVTGSQAKYVGGLVGQNYTSNPSIASSYSTSLVTGDANYLGGLIGGDLTQTGNSNDYWDLDTSGITRPAQGAGNVSNDPGLKGLKDSQLKSGLPGGFDKTNWKQNAKINNGYPYLVANVPPR